MWARPAPRSAASAPSPGRSRSAGAGRRRIRADSGAAPPGPGRPPPSDSTISRSRSAAVPPMPWTFRPSAMISETDIRGLKDPNGSWKTICICRRSGRSSLNCRPCSGLPSNRMSPSEPIRRNSARPSVVLPEPDSPTTPTVWPSRTSTSMPSTALTWSTVAGASARAGSGTRPSRRRRASPPARRDARGAGLPFGSAASRRRV